MLAHSQGAGGFPFHRGHCFCLRRCFRKQIKLKRYTVVPCAMYESLASASQVALRECSKAPATPHGRFLRVSRTHSRKGNRQNRVGLAGGCGFKATAQCKANLEGMMLLPMSWMGQDGCAPSNNEIQ
jgi:hypothetical protein